MLKGYVLGLTAAIAISASPAMAATTINFTNPTAITGPVFTTGGATVTGYTFGVAPTSLNNTSQLTAGAKLAISANGIGVCSESAAPSSGTISGGAGECPQVDTNGGPNEAMRIDFTGSTTTNILSAVLNIVDTDDTLRLYGVGSTGALQLLGFGGTIMSGTGYTSQHNGGTQYTLTFNPVVSGFSSYIFTSNRDSNDGYRLKSLTVAGVPELEVWAMLLLGFGAVGLQMRRRRVLKAVTA